MGTLSTVRPRKPNLNTDDTKRAGFAIQSGRPKIIDSEQEALELDDLQVVHTQGVLRERGNMPSATLPYVWAQTVNDKLPIGTTITNYAFGPGLTLFGAVFQVC
jgi:predicted naringenin-chalcone synthase